MKRPFLLSIATLLYLGASSLNASAQSADQPPVPHEPLLGRLPNPGRWQITLQYKGGSTAQPDRSASKGPVGEHVVSIFGESQGQLYHQISSYASGAKKENWSLNGVQVCRNIYSNSYILVKGGHPFYVDFAAGDLGDLSWIGMDDYVGVSGQDPPVFTFTTKNADRRLTPMEKEEYALQVDNFELAQNTGSPAQRKAVAESETRKYFQQKFGATESTVTLNAITQLPITYDDGAIIRTYAFSNNVPALSMPPEAVQAMRYWTNLEKANTIHPNPP
jgi:hypothetical protein